MIDNKSRHILAQGVSRSIRKEIFFTCCLTDESRPLIHAVQAECINSHIRRRNEAWAMQDSFLCLKCKGINQGYWCQRLLVPVIKVSRCAPAGGLIIYLPPQKLPSFRTAELQAIENGYVISREKSLRAIIH